MIICSFDGRAVDDRVILKHFSKVLSEANLPNLKLFALKTFGKSIIGEEKKPISELYYLSNVQKLVIPDKKTEKRYSSKKDDRIVQLHDLNKYLPKNDNKNVSLLLKYLANDPELKNELLDKLKIELLNHKERT